MDVSEPTKARAARKGRPSLDDAQRLADDIMDQAIRLFREQGFGATSVEAISAAAGISKRTYYTRFAGKDEVFEAVILRYVERNVAVVPQWESAAQATLEDRFFTMAQHMLDWILQPDVLGIYRMTIAEVQRFPKLAHMVAEYAVVNSARAFEPVIREAAGDGLDDETISFVANQFMQTVAAEPFHRAIQGLDLPGMNDVKRLRLRRAVRLFLDGFGQHAISK
jgi:AcrR family transcriptional regulator